MRVHKVFLSLSLLLFVFGILTSIFTFYLFPSLIPAYGGGESIQLKEENNYEMIFAFEPQYKLTITIEVDNPIIIAVNQKENITGTYYSATLNTSVYYLVKIKGTTLTDGFMRLRQEIPIRLQMFSLGMLFSGVVLFSFSIFIAIRSKQSRAW